MRPSARPGTIHSGADVPLSRLQGIERISCNLLVLAGDRGDLLTLITSPMRSNGRSLVRFQTSWMIVSGAELRLPALRHEAGVGAVRPGPDIPAPDLRGCGGQQLEDLLRRMRRQSAPLPGLPRGAGDAIHRGHRAVISVLVQLPGPDLADRQVRVCRQVDHLQHSGPFSLRQGRRRLRSFSMRDRVGLACRRAGPSVVGGPGSAGQRARCHDRQRQADQLGERIIQERDARTRLHVVPAASASRALAHSATRV